MDNKNLNTIKELLISDSFVKKNITIEDDFIYKGLDSLFISSNEEKECLLFIDSEDEYIEVVVFENEKLKEIVESFTIEYKDLNNIEKITNLINENIFENYFKNNANELDLI